MNLRLENFSNALEDANESVKNNNKNPKAFYRRGQANVSLRKLKEGVDDFKKCCLLDPKNREARNKYDFTLKEYKSEQLAKALSYDDASKTVINAEDIAVEAAYTGPKLDEEKKTASIDSEWVVSLMNWQKDQKTLHKKYATMIIQKASEIFEKEKNMVQISVPDEVEITVCGDVHGQYYDLMNLFSINGNPSETNPYLFNGDFIDRGSFSVEVLITMLAWKVAYPKHFFMSRGNHESKNLNKMYGFCGEIKKKYDEPTYNLCSDLFCNLPLCHLINKKVFVTHGGLFSKDNIKLE